jgi:NTP pyrophosphatase (non-canonical NTP hydrolase)
MNEERADLEFKKLQSGASLGEVFVFSDGLTHERNQNQLPTAAHRILHLARGAGEMAKSVTVHNTAILAIVASKMTLRIFGVLEILNAKDEFIEALMRKYPEAGCSYCGNKPCQCGIEKTNTIAKHEPSETQRTWSIREWQNHMKSVYGTKNDALSLDSVVLRLSAEIGEVAEAGLLSDRIESKGDAEKFRIQMLSELADSFVWLVAICNHHEVNADFEATFIARYGKGCPNCGQYPCSCEQFTYIDERKDPRNRVVAK